MIVTVGDSRVGKSTVLKLLIDLLLKESQRLKVYNYDNRQKLEAYKDIIPLENLNFFRGDGDQLVEDINQDEIDVILADMPGQYVDEICDYIEEIDLFQLLEKYEWKLTFLQPISHRIDCLKYMEKILNWCGDEASYVVVKNEYFDSRFYEYNQRKSSEITEIILTKLHRDHYESLERLGKPYCQVATEQSLYLVYRSYIYQWINKFNKSVLENTIARKYLGLSSF